MYTNTFLSQKNIQIFVNDQQILKGEDNDFYAKQNTKIPKGYHLLNEEDYDIKQIDYRQLKEFNISIVQWRVSPNNVQQVMYYLAYDESQAYDYGMIPSKDYRIEFDSFQRAVRLIGPKVYNGKTEWLSVDRSKHFEEEEGYNSEIKKAKENLEELYPSGMFQHKVVYLDVHDVIPIGISSFGELVCLPKIVGDAPRIGVAGESGQGKSWIGHRIKDSILDQECARVIELNDRKMETGEYVEPWNDNSRFSNDLLRINEFPKPQPMIFLHPMNNTLSDRHRLHKGTLGFDISIPFSKIINDVDILSCYYDLGKSGNYIQNITKRLAECKTLEEMEAVVDSEIQNKKNPTGQIPFSSASKIKTFWSNLWKTNILDISNKIDPVWVANLDGHRVRNYPWIIGLVSGLSVAIETSHIIKEPYYPAILKFLLENIFEEKKTNPLLKDLILMIFTDEIPELLKNKDAFALINDVIRLGRSDGVGFCITVQYYEDILPEIRTNLSHFFIFKQKIENKGIKRDFFNGYPNMFKETMNLKNRQCIACGEFILYNSLSGEKYSNNGVPIKMKLLPPNSKHHGPPGVK